MLTLYKPNRSATLPKNRRKAPLLKDDEADIQVICAVVMPRSLPMKDEFVVTDPVSREPIAIAMVAVNTKRTSCTVDLKQAGRPLSVWMGSMDSMVVCSPLSSTKVVIGGLFCP